MCTSCMIDYINVLIFFTLHFEPAPFKNILKKTFISKPLRQMVQIPQIALFSEFRALCSNYLREALSLCVAKNRYGY